MTSACTAEEDIQITFVNFDSEPVSVYWVNPELEHVEMGKVEPYDSQTFDTVHNAEWIFRWGDHGKHGVSFRAKRKHTIKPIPRLPHDAVPVVCSTTKGDMRIQVKPEWAPVGAARFLELVTQHHLDGVALNRVVPNSLTQFGIPANYETRTQYKSKTILDDTRKEQFQEGYLSFAGSGPNSRTTEMFVVMPGASVDQFGTNLWESPFAYVDPRDLKEVVGNWYQGYGDMPPWGHGPDPQQINQPNGYDTYLKNNFPELDYINSCRIVSEGVVRDEL